MLWSNVNIIIIIIIIIFIIFIIVIVIITVIIIVIIFLSLLTRMMVIFRYTLPTTIHITNKSAIAFKLTMNIWKSLIDNYWGSQHYTQ